MNPDIKYSDESSGEEEEVKIDIVPEIMIKSDRYENSKKDFDYNDGFMISFTPA